MDKEKPDKKPKKASKKYKMSRFTTCNFVILPDDTQVISFYDPKAKGKKHLKFKVKNLSRKNEKILEDEEE